MYDILIIGSGNVASSLYQIFEKQGLRCAMAARSRDRALEITQSEDNVYGIDKIPSSRFVIIAVKDGVVAEVSSMIAAQVMGQSIVCHTAGSVALDTLDKSISHRGVFYPLQTFSKGREFDIVKFTIFVEASDNKTLEELEKLALMVSPRCEHLSSKQREMMHLAAVFVSNFSNYMYIAASDILKDSGVEFSHMKPLIEECAAKVCQSNLPPEDMQTGPAARGDHSVINKHISLLEDSILKELYSTLSGAIESRCNEKF